MYGYKFGHKMSTYNVSMYLKETFENHTKNFGINFFEVSSFINFARKLSNPNKRKS